MGRKHDSSGEVEGLRFGWGSGFRVRVVRGRENTRGYLRGSGAAIKIEVFEK
jgi:hypothetical protein